MSTTEYVVSGMTCEHCANAVTEEVGAIDGVTAATVTLEGGKLQVTSDAQVPFSAIEAAVDEAGDYKVALA